MTNATEARITALWSQVFHASERELDAKFAGNHALSLRWASIRVRGTKLAVALEAQMV